MEGYGVLLSRLRGFDASDDVGIQTTVIQGCRCGGISIKNCTRPNDPLSSRSSTRDLVRNASCF